MSRIAACMVGSVGHFGSSVQLIISYVTYFSSSKNLSLYTCMYWSYLFHKVLWIMILKKHYTQLFSWWENKQVLRQTFDTTRKRAGIGYSLKVWSIKQNNQAARAFWLKITFSCLPLCKKYTYFKFESYVGLRWFFRTQT